MCDKDIEMEYAPGIIRVDVRMDGHLMTTDVATNSKCSSILRKFNVDPCKVYLMHGSKPLDYNRAISDYNFTGRFAVEVLQILHGGGTFFFVFRFAPFDYLV